MELAQPFSTSTLYSTAPHARGNVRIVSQLVFLFAFNSLRSFFVVVLCALSSVAFLSCRSVLKESYGCRTRASQLLDFGFGLVGFAAVSKRNLHYSLSQYLSAQHSG